MADTDQVKVVIRVRPLIQREQQADQDARWSVKEEKVISQCDQPNLPPYVFDQVYDRDCSTWEVYSGVISPIVDAAMNGYHGTVFVYGQSGSGKTYTMSGNKMTPGIISQAMTDIFDFIEQKPSHEFLIRASYMEIYNEKIYDLLNKDDKHIKLQETPDHQINVVGLEEKMVNTCQQALHVIQSGEAKRTFAETKQNDRSSRSHCIFRIIIESRDRKEVDAAVKVSHLNFVDLAGSEKAGENSGDRFREGCSINKSLFCLSNVISKLSEGVSNQFIGYRDSKLTRILQNALGGNSKTVIAATINPTTIEESHSTLRFATRAKSIKNKPHVNEVLSEAAMLKKYRNEITRLQRLVKEMGVADMQSMNEDLKKQLDDKQLLIRELTQQIVVSSSLSETTGIQKKKMRRETWCAPKMQHKSFFPALPPIDRSQVTIREETAFDLDLAQAESLDLPFTNISVSVNDESKTKAFLRRSDEMAVSESSLMGALTDEESRQTSEGKDQTEEVERLEEVIRLMEVEHAKEMETMQERVKQLEFERAMELDNREEKEKTMTSDQEEEVVRLKEEIEWMQHEQQLVLGENRSLQTRLWHAEEDVKRLTQETCHLCNKRFDISLQEWEQLELSKTLLEAEMKQLGLNLQDKEKEITELQRALAGQEPYIARLEQQLEMYIGNDQGQLGGRSKRRSGIPVPVKTEEENCTTALDPHSQTMAEATDEPCSRSSEALPAHVPQTVTVRNRTSTLDGLKYDSSQKTHSVSAPEQISAAAETTGEQDSQTSADSCSKVDNVFFSQAAEDATLPDSQEVIGTAVSATESSTKLATRLKRRSDGTVALPLDANAEMSAKLREQELLIEQLNAESARMLEVLNQANAEIIRYKEVMEAMELADLERMEELSEVPKLKALLNRRDMEVQRLESLNARLKEELTQQALNSSTSSLSSSFSEPRRKSAMLKEREAEVWKLKDQLVQQARRLDDIQQEKLALEDIVVDLQIQPAQGADDSCITTMKRTSSSSSLPSAIELNVSAEGEEEEEGVEAEEQHQGVVTYADYESAMRKLSRLETQLQEKEEEMDQMFEGQMLIPSDMIQSHLQKVEQQEQKIEELEEQLKSREEELTKLKAVTEMRKSSTGNQGEESSFQEQLIMDKISLEEALQEKVQELATAVEQSQDLRLQLDERRQLVNELRQKHEDVTEALLSTQEEIIALKQKSEQDEQHDEKNTSQQIDFSSQASAAEEQTPREEQDSFEVSFKTTSIENPALADSHAEPSEILKALQQREQDHLDLLEEKEKEILSLRAEQAKVPGAASTEVAELPLVEDLSTETSHISSHTGSDNTDTPSNIASSQNQREQLTALIEEKRCLESRLKETADVTEEKIVLESRVKELLTVIEEKSSLISHLQKLVENAGLETETLTTQSVNSSGSEPAEALSKESCSEEDVSAVQAKLANLSALEESLAQNIKQLEQIQEEKATLDARVQELEADLEEMTTAKESAASKTTAIQHEKEAFENQIKELLTEKESLRSQLEQLKSNDEQDNFNSKVQESHQSEQETPDTQEELAAELKSLKSNLKQLNSDYEQSVLQTTALEKEVFDKKAEIESMHSQIQQAEETQAQLTACRAQRDELEVKFQELKSDLESKLESSAHNLVQANAQVKELSSQVESLKSDLQQAKSDCEQSVLQKTASEKEILELKTEGESLRSQILQIETEAQELTSKIDELNSSLEQLQVSNEELTSELTWQTKACEELQSRVDELETEAVEQKQEAEELMQELEKAQKLQEGSEQCQRYVEETLEEFKKQNKQLEADKQILATERDEFELKEEVARKEQERLRLELQVTLDRLNSRIAALELEVQTESQRKEVLEAALADKESAQHMGELLHEKLSTELQESQTEVMNMKATMSKLQSALQGQESKFVTLEKTKVSLQAERDQLTKVKTSLEVERTELKVKLLSAEENIQSLQRVLDDREEDTEAKKALQTEVAGCQKEIQHLQAEVQQLQLMKGELEERAATVEMERSRLQDELGLKMEDIERLQKEIEAAKSSADASLSGSSKMVPLIEVKRQKFVLKNEIRRRAQELEGAREALKCQSLYVSELQERLAKYENEEQEDKDIKIETLENRLKARELETVGLKMKQQEELSKLRKQLSHAEEMTEYKEKMLGKLKAEIRRIQSEQVSFCVPSVPKARTAVPESVKSEPVEEREISSHSGIIDRYTVTLLERDKYKLQKELKKTQDRLKCRESELHYTKVALAKTTKGGSPSASFSSSSPPVYAEGVASSTDRTSSTGEIKSERLSMPALQTEHVIGRFQSPRARYSVDSSVEGPRSPLLQRLGTSVDGLMSGPDSIAKTARQRNDSSLLQDSVSAGGTSVDFKRDRPLLPSAIDKENTPLGTDVLLSDKTSAVSKADPAAGGDSPINIEPEFWKKSQRSRPSVYRPASQRPWSKSAAAATDQCKTQ